MNPHIRPNGNDRFVAVEHGPWKSQWRMQFPEAISANEGTIMAWPSNCHPEWKALNGNGWAYTWRTTAAYGAEVCAMNHRDTGGNPQYSDFFVGLALRAEILSRNDGLHLSLTLTNESSRTVHSVSCDGGCWQAKSKTFMGCNEVTRSYAMVKGKMLSMDSLARTVAIRCMYRCDPSAYDGKGEWFWGHSSTAIDAPAILGATSDDGTKALVLGYDGAVSGLANSDDHHCLHSSPFFGDIAPGQSVRRIGYVLFGSDIQTLADALRRKLETAKQDRASNKASEATR